MSYLIDTNVISELVRPKPDAAVLDWFASTPDEVLFLSALPVRVVDARRLAGIR